MPKQLASGLMFGTGLSVPVPDLDRTDHLLILGANPLASNGTLMTAPDMRGRLRAIRERGGKVVVVDPRRIAHRRGGRRAPLHPPRHRRAAAVRDRRTCCSPRASRDPGGSPSTLDRARRGRASWREPFTPEAVAAATRHRRRRRSAASRASSPPPPRAAVYGRIGTDDAGVRHARELARRRAQRPHRQPRPRRAARCSRSAAAGSGNTTGEPGPRPRRRLGAAGRAACAGAPRSFGELPVGLPGRGDRRRPARARSARCSRSPATRCSRRPNGDRLGRRARHARPHGQRRHLRQRDDAPRRRDPARARRRSSASHYDLALYQFAVRNVANYSPPVLPLARGRARRVGDPAAARRRSPPARAPTPTSTRSTTFVAGELARRAVAPARLAARGPRPGGAARRARAARGPERLLDLHAAHRPVRRRLRRATPDGLTLAELEAAPHGIDLGPLEPRLPEVLRTASGKIELAPGADRRRRAAAARRARARPTRNGGMVLIGRRQLRSNNSWMHNLPKLVSGQGALHAARPPRRRRAARARRRRAGASSRSRARRDRRCRSRSPTT